MAVLQVCREGDNGVEMSVYYDDCMMDACVGNSHSVIQSYHKGLYHNKKSVKVFNIDATSNIIETNTIVIIMFYR